MHETQEKGRCKQGSNIGASGQTRNAFTLKRVAHGYASHLAKNVVWRMGNTDGVFAGSQIWRH
jgi:hypothetical protein